LDRYITKKETKELIAIDTFFLTEKITGAKSFKDPFFPGLSHTLKEKGLNYAYLPNFYSPSYNKKPFELLRVLKILKDEKVPAVTEYQLLSLRDLVRLFLFILRYPLHLLKFYKNLSSAIIETRLIKHEIVNTMDQVVFYAFSRYLQGKNIAKLGYDDIKMISWYENHPHNKYLYKGLRASGQNCKIYGAQFFLYSKGNINIMPDENEIPFGIVPDKILVNGSSYIPDKTRLNYSIGPSLRYAHIFNGSVDAASNKNILVMLPYSEDAIRNILRLISSVKISLDIIIKAHPSISIHKYRHLMPGKASLTEEDGYKLFEKAKMLISAGSGTLIEAASLGIPVIIIRDPGSCDINNPLPDYGRGIVWEEADSPEDLIFHIDKFDKALKTNQENIKVVADRYKKIFFCEPTENNIMKAFEL